MTFGHVDRGGFDLRYEEAGTGSPVIFQHGLGGDAAQVAEVFPSTPPTRRVTLECRGQGGSAAGPPADFAIATFAEDVAFVASRLGIGRAVFGGISMGAAIALRLAVTRPDLVGALVLGRPAWVYHPAPENMQPVALVAGLLRTHDPAEAREAFEQSETAIRLAREAPDNLVSLRGFFDRPDPATTAALLAAISGDGPGVTEEQARRITVPTLVIGTAADAIHPMDFATRLAATIPDATLVEITPKSIDRPRYVAEFKAALSAFLARVAG